jgi:hypothetical protein
LNFKLGDLPKGGFFDGLQKLTKLIDDVGFGTKFAVISRSKQH